MHIITNNKPVAHDPYDVAEPLQHEVTIGRWTAQFYELDDHGDGVLRLWLDDRFVHDTLWSLRESTGTSAGDTTILDVHDAGPLSRSDFNAMCSAVLDELCADTWRQI